MPLSTILQTAAHQGHRSWWSLRTTKRRISVRFPRPFFRGVLLVPEWPWRDYLSGSRRA